MVDDFLDPNNPDQDCHSVEAAEMFCSECGQRYWRLGKFPEGDETKCPDCLDKEDGISGFTQPANLRTVWWRLPEVITDTINNQLSAIRWLIMVCGVCLTAVIVAAILGAEIPGHVTSMLGVISGAACAGYGVKVYGDYRWRKRCEEEKKDA